MNEVEKAFAQRSYAAMVDAYNHMVLAVSSARKARACSPQGEIEDQLESLSQKLLDMQAEMGVLKYELGSIAKEADAYREAHQE